MDWPRITEGVVEKLVLLLILFLCGWAGNIMWNAAINQKETIQSEVQAAVDVLSGRIAELEARIENLQDALIDQSSTKPLLNRTVPNHEATQQRIIDDIQIQSLDLRRGK